MTNPRDRLTIRPMTLAELDLAIEWAAQEEWNPGLYDAPSFYAADEHGFLVGELEGEPVSCISAVRYGQGFAFLGFYLVKPSQRGRGYGLATWQAALARLEGRVIGLDGVLAQVPNYERSGFVAAYRTVRYGGTPAGNGGRAQAAAQVPPDELTAFDLAHFGSPREGFLQSWLRQPEGKAVALRDGDGLRGYGAIRRCRHGHRLGPLFARDEATARELFGALVEGREGTVFVDIPEPNQRAAALASDLGLAPGFETVRMYRGEPPRLPLHEIYGVTSLELG